MVYDDVQGRILMFGGFGSSGASTNTPLNDLWAWDGQHWTLLGTGGPSARGDMLAAWDGTRRRLVIYGGATDEGPQGDTWEWDGSTWSQRATGGPPVRRHFGGGFDKGRGRVVLFGGLLATGDSPVFDTWEWNGTAWTQAASTSPGGIQAPSGSMAYSEKRGALLMLVGWFSAGASDLWKWDGSTWTSIGAGPSSVSMPLPLVATGDDEITALAWTGKTMRWRDGAFSTVATAGPTSPTGAAVAYDKARGRMVAFGGLLRNSTTSETWLWDGSAWALATLQ
jgi:hypothetical protein